MVSGANVPIFIALLLVGTFLVDGVPETPNIIIIVADDLGWNDVSYHGSNQIPTPNIDALAYNGVILDRFYTSPTCTPTRASLLTGQNPTRFGFQGYPMVPGERTHLPFDTPTLPEHLKNLGYATHLVGKWHLGFAYQNVTPTGRGFDTHFGYWNGYIGYFTDAMTLTTPGVNVTGLDFHDGLTPVPDYVGRYVTDVFTEKAVEVIKEHDKDESLFLMVAHLAPHSGNLAAMEVENVTENDQRFAYVEDEQRRRFAGMLTKLDESVGTIIKTLQDEGLLENSIVLFFSDNGAETIGDNRNHGSNWPLRGQKFSTYEGGVRTPAIVYSPLLSAVRGVRKDIVHVTDFLPTFVHVAGGNATNLTNLDGVNQWETIARRQPTERNNTLIAIDETQNLSTLIGDFGRYKLVNGSTTAGDIEQYLGETGRGTENPSYNVTAVLNSEANIAISETGGEFVLTERVVLVTRSQVDLVGCRAACQPRFVCKGFCLFDLERDPCETTDVAAENEEVVERLKVVLEGYWRTLVPRQEIFIDPLANPAYYNGSWYPWLDDESIKCNIISQDVI